VEASHEPDRKLIDLGAWASEEHKIPVAPDAEDEMFSGDFDPRH
jgi:endogenous inhibitor of DNA gyrase (YacG/DUF329 family)